MRGQPVIYPARNSLKPRQPVGIVERLTGPHLLNIGWRVEIVTLLKGPVKDALQFKRYRRFATARNPHQHQDHRRDHLSGGDFQSLNVNIGFGCRHVVTLPGKLRTPS
jgi:hypothetical protein